MEPFTDGFPIAVGALHEVDLWPVALPLIDDDRLGVESSLTLILPATALDSGTRHRGVKMDTWWGSLGNSLQIFWGIAIVTSAVMAVQLVLMLLGFDGDSDVDMDTDTDLDGGDGGNILSVRTITAFFAGFGWSGVACLDAGYSLLTTLLISTAVGSVFMLGVFALMRFLYGLRYSGTLDYRNAIGEIGSVYLPVPGEMSGPGKVEVLVQGRLRVVDAFNKSADSLPNRSRVKVVDVIDQNTLVVEPLGPDYESKKQEA